MSDEFEAHRRRCFAIAYRMLGSAAEAEDVLQEAWIFGVHVVMNPDKLQALQQRAH